MKKTLAGSMVVLVVVLVVSLTAAYANHQGGMACKAGYGSKHRGGGGQEGNLEKIFFMKSHFILENSTALGLADDKVEAVKTLMLDTKKSLIKQSADIEVTCIDIKSKLHEYPVDVNAVNKLIDQKYEFAKAKTKTLVEAIAKVKSTLTKEQYDKLREIWKGTEKPEHHEGK
ncbi:MAG: hypothetical protein HZC17_00335 [Candidatus Omnitrophica bacterium]|nr:hypothetical protein [Candidatus Omnitrophota bacterium]